MNEESEQPCRVIISGSRDAYEHCKFGQRRAVNFQITRATSAIPNGASTPIPTLTLSIHQRSIMLRELQMYTVSLPMHHT